MEQQEKRGFEGVGGGAEGSDQGLGSLLGERGGIHPNIGGHPK